MKLKTMKVAIAIFVKTPGLSPLKTRLAATIGQQKAEFFYRLSLKSIVSTLREVEISPYWAVGEVNGLYDPLWDDFEKLHTGDGDLGDRQSHVYNKLLKTFEAVILIGADAPQLSKKFIEEAITALRSHDFVIGPATDGGYYLLGGRSKIASQAWSETPWSHENTREILVSKLDSKPHLLAMLTDVDTKSDFKCVLDEMPKPADGLQNENQQHLINWIKRL